MQPAPARSPRVRRWSAVIFAIAASAAGPQAGAADELLAASSDEHLWVLVDVQQPRPGVLIYHHALAMAGPYFTVTPQVQSFAQPPQALAAWGERVWIVLHPDRQQTQPTRAVFTVSMRPNNLVGGYDFSPSDRLEVVAPLPGYGRLAGFVGTAAGPLALIVPAQWASAGVHRADEAAPVESEPDSPALLHLRHDGWTAFDLPAGFDRKPAPADSAATGGDSTSQIELKKMHLTWRLAAGGPEGRTIWLVGASSGPRQSAIVYRLDGESWTQSSVPIVSASIQSLTRVGSQVAAIMDGFQPGMIEAVVLRSGTALPLADWPEPSGRWSVLGMRDGLRVIKQLQGSISMARIDWPTGTVGPAESLMRQPRELLQVLHIPILLAAGLTAMLAVLMLRPPDAQSKLTIPPGLALLQPGARLMALAIDLLPGSVLAVLILDCPPARLLQVPIFAARLDDALPSMLMIAITIAHSTITEGLTGRTVGKAALGAMLIGNDGSRPGWFRVIERNIFKALTMCIPALAVFAIFNPQWKGLGDVVASTVVVRQRENQPATDQRRD